MGVCLWNVGSWVLDFQSQLFILTNWQQFFMVCTLINHRNDVKLFKTQVEQWVIGEWFHYKILNFLTSFLSSMRVQTLEIVVNLFFYNDMDSFDVHFHWRFSENLTHARKRKTNCATITSFPWSSLFWNIALDQSACKNGLVILKSCIVLSTLT